MRINSRKFLTLTLVLALVDIAAAQGSRRPQSQSGQFDVIIRGGTVYDGTGRPPLRADVGIKEDRVAAIGNLSRATAPTIIDARGLAVAPGFINMLSHSESSLIVDGRSLGEIKQGVTTQIFGEFSMGPLNDQMKRRLRESQGDAKYDIEWTTLAEFLNYLEKRGVSQNVASFIGASTVREYVIGLEDKPPTPEQLAQMRELVRREMEAGALGITTALIYPPAFFAKTDELTIYFLMSEENIKKQIRQPWVSFGSDAASIAPEGVYLKSSAHPRAYGNFARLLGKYVREEKVISLADAVRRLSGLPATNLGLEHRGFLKPGMFADVVVFDPQMIADRATFPNPHRYAVGVRHVFVNGVQVLKDGEHTGAKPGRALWGPGRIK
jgi:N-acyl-D-aspartate/D-glutamate deacylase